MIGRGFEPFFELSKKAMRTTARLMKITPTGEEVTALAEFWNQLEPYSES